MPSVKNGDIVHIKFLDHTENEDDVALIHAVGVVVDNTSKSLVIRSWWPEDYRGEGRNDTTTYHIVRSCITGINIMDAIYE